MNSISFSSIHISKTHEYKIEWIWNWASLILSVKGGDNFKYMYVQLETQLYRVGNTSWYKSIEWEMAIIIIQLLKWQKRHDFSFSRKLWVTKKEKLQSINSVRFYCGGDEIWLSLLWRMPAIFVQFFVSGLVADSQL